MRKLIIDTDIGSDDAVALIMALKQKEVQILAVTAVAGNCSIDQVVNNALMTIETVGTQKPPVYRGTSSPIMRERVEAVNVHGQDGMGDCGLIHPASAAAEGYAVTAMLDLIRRNPGEVEIISLGPVTNIALAIMMDRETMRKTKHIWSMGTGGFGLGNCSPYAEFNVYADPEGYEIMLRSGIPLTIAGFDVCLQEGLPLTEEDVSLLLHSSVPEAVFAARCNQGLLNYNLRSSGRYFIDLPDAVAMAAALWDDIVLDAPRCFCRTSLTDKAVYGQVAVYPEDRKEFLNEFDSLPKNAVVIRKINASEYKSRLLRTLCRRN